MRYLLALLLIFAGPALADSSLPPALWANEQRAKGKLVLLPLHHSQ